MATALWNAVQHVRVGGRWCGGAESLEKRALLSAVLKPAWFDENLFGLSLTGTDGNDQIRVVLLGQHRLQVYGIEGVADGTIFENIFSMGINGGKGDDVIRVEGSYGATFNLGGGEGTDLLVNAADTGAGLHGGEGDDTMIGSAHHDTFSTEPGNDVYYGGEGPDDRNDGKDRSDPDDELYEGADTLFHYGEHDFGFTGLRLVVRLDKGTIPEDGFGGRDRIYDIENVNSVADTDDIIFGDHQANRILADYGRDSVFAGAGDDTIIANKGYATILAGAGDDTVYSSVWNVSYIDGGAGADVLHIGGFTQIPVGDTIVADKHDDVRYNLRPLDPEEPREAKILEELERKQREATAKRGKGLRLASVVGNWDKHESAFENLLGKSMKKRAVIGKPRWMNR